MTRAQELGGAVAVFVATVILAFCLGVWVTAHQTSTLNVVRMTCFTAQGAAVWDGALPEELMQHVHFPKSLACIRHEHVELVPTPWPTPTVTPTPVATPTPPLS